MSYGDQNLLFPESVHDVTLSISNNLKSLIVNCIGPNRTYLETDFDPEEGQFFIPNSNLLSEMATNHRYFVPKDTEIDRIIIDWSKPNTPATGSLEWRCAENKIHICSVSTKLSPVSSSNAKTWQELYESKIQPFAFPSNWPDAYDIPMPSFSPRFINNARRVKCTNSSMTVAEVVEDENRYYLNVILVLPQSEEDNIAQAYCLNFQEFGLMGSKNYNNIVVPCGKIDGTWFADRSALFVSLNFGDKEFLFPREDLKKHGSHITSSVFGLLPTGLILPFTTYLNSKDTNCKNGTSRRVYRLIQLQSWLFKHDVEDPADFKGTKTKLERGDDEESSDPKRIKMQMRRRSKMRRKKSAA